MRARSIYQYWALRHLNKELCDWDLHDRNIHQQFHQSNDANKCMGAMGSHSDYDA